MEGSLVFDALLGFGSVVVMNYVLAGYQVVLVTTERSMIEPIHL
jgi:hypothetical protein